MLRLESRNDCRVALNWTPVGKRAVGRTKDTWRRMVDKERRAFRWKSWNEAARKATDKSEWRLFVHAICDTWRLRDPSAVSNPAKVFRKGFHLNVHTIGFRRQTQRV